MSRVRGRAALLAVALCAGSFAGTWAEAGEEISRARTLADDLHSRFLEEREAAKRALITLGDSAEPVMIEALGDPDRRVRQAAAEVLGAIGSERAVEALLDAFEADFAVMRTVVPRLLAGLGDPARRAVDRRLARRPDGSEALDAVRRAFVQVEVEKILSGLITERYSYGFYAGQFRRVEEIGKSAVPVLMGMFTDPTFEFLSTDPKRRHIMRSLAGEALADMQDRSIVPALRELIESTTSPAELAFERQELEDTLAYVLFKLGEKQYLTDMAYRLENYMKSSRRQTDLTPRLVGLLVRMGDYARAEHYYKQILLEDHMRAGWAFYNLACLYAIQNKKKEALDHLERAIEDGFADVDWIKQDGDLRNLHGDPRYEALIRAAEERDRLKKRNPK